MIKTNKKQSKANIDAVQNIFNTTTARLRIIGISNIVVLLNTRYLIKHISNLSKEKFEKNSLSEVMEVLSNRIRISTGKTTILKMAEKTFLKLPFNTPIISLNSYFLYTHILPNKFNKNN